MCKCKYSPFCYQTNPRHLSSYKHTSIEDIDVEDVIQKLQNERFLGKGQTSLLNNVIEWSKATLKPSKKRYEYTSLTNQQFNRIMHLHTRIQEEAFPNMEIMSLLWNYNHN